MLGFLRMGPFHSREATVIRQRDRKRCAKELLNASRTLAAAHARYLQCLRCSGSAVVQFAVADSALDHSVGHNRLLGPLTLRQPSESYADSSTFTAASSYTSRSEFPASPSPPSAPPLPRHGGHFFWYDPKGKPLTTTETSENSVSISVPSSDVIGIMKGLDEGFQRAADSGEKVSKILGLLLSTAQTVYAWEKKLYKEMKKGMIDQGRLRKIELEKGGCGCMKKDAHKGKKMVEKLKSQLIVSSKIIYASSSELINLRDGKLYTEVLQHTNGLMHMWTIMYYCHEEQRHIVDQLNHLTPPSQLPEPTTSDKVMDIHRESTVHLEREMQHLLHSIVNLVDSQQSYVRTLTRWLRLSLLLHDSNHSSLPPPLLSLCGEWRHGIGQIPVKETTKGIRHFIEVVHASTTEQELQQKHRKKFQRVIQKKQNQLLLRLSKCSNHKQKKNALSSTSEECEDERHAKQFADLTAELEEEKTNLGKLIALAKTNTLDNLRIGLPEVMVGLLEFSNASKDAVKSLYDPR